MTEFIMVIVTTAIAVLATHLISMNLNKDESFGFSIGMVWMVFVRFIFETFA